MKKPRKKQRPIVYSSLPLMDLVLLEKFFLRR